MKYKAYLTDSDKIFWTKNSVDKPSLAYFLNLMDTVVWKEIGDITPNFENQFNGSLVVDSDKYTYLRLVDNVNGETKYFSIDRVSKILNNGYVIDITLDVFTTYTLDYFNNHIKNYPIKLNRTTLFKWYKNTLTAQIANDPLINRPSYIKPFYVKENFSFGINNTAANRDNYDSRGYLYKMTSNSEWALEKRYFDCELNKSVDLTQNYIPILTNPVFDVYQDTTGDYYFFPIFSLTYSTTLYPYIGVKFNGETFYRYCNTSLYNVEKLKANTFWVNKYVGRFNIPMWHVVMSQSRWMVARTNTGGVDNCIFGFFFSCGINSLRGNQLLTQHLIYDVDGYDNSTVDPNSREINKYVLSKLSAPNGELPLFNVYKDGITGAIPNVFLDTSWTISFYFDKSTGFEFFSNNLPQIGNNLAGYETIPTSTSQYDSYVAGVQTQQNTNIQIAKQQMAMGITQNIWGGAMGLMRAGTNVAGGIISGNPTAIAGGITGAADSLFNTGFGIAKNIQQFQNAKRQQDAANLDRRNSSTANQFNPSNKNNNYFNSYLTRQLTASKQYQDISRFCGLLLMVPPKYHDIAKEYNKIVWESGYYINITTKLDSDFFEDTNNIFVYWDIELNEDYVKYSLPNLNSELIAAITTTINNPVRFWKQHPDYNAVLKIV